ncbi:phosphotransferase enzyme family protein [Candidatus Enterococcus clewellii]|uniref:Aminoglycoside phosphotransferase domain-containing protein n=1 Tax=Candidatus Enterococcus clewellii TaxID=1834193 RepID=A0A242KBN8_9ENTE|nr:aminoglycoside phosphotransferase family protein [Enterococcus sp. 9E7_DIV0242]OTP18581.1 hypothetical protein A5888_000395 [Enterococcus sp. 9E7_DIV0242]
MKKTLFGGRADKIFKQADTVVRPTNRWTKNVHTFLHYLKNKKIAFVPTPISLMEQEEVVSFMPGKVYNEPLPASFFTDELIVSAAQLLRDFHEAGSDYVDRLTGTEEWMLAVTEKPEVMCHGDFAPYNVTVNDGKAVGMFDFDTLHPGSRIEDIAYAVYRWVPFYDGNQSTEKAQNTWRRFRLFIDAYGLEASEKEQLPAAMVKRLDQLIAFMKREAEKGNSDFRRNIEEGHLDKYRIDRIYISEMKAKMLRIMNDPSVLIEEDNRC